MRRDCFVRSTAFGVGPIWTVATSLSITLRPDGVSSCMFSTSVTLSRADGIAVTWTSAARPRAKMSLTSSLAIRADVCRRISPGVSPTARALAKSVSTWICGRSVCSEACASSTRDVADPLLDGLGLLLQLREVGPVNAHHDGLAATGQHFLDALPEIGLYVAKEPWV